MQIGPISNVNNSPKQNFKGLIKITDPRVNVVLQDNLPLATKSANKVISAMVDVFENKNVTLLFRPNEANYIMCDYVYDLPILKVLHDMKIKCKYRKLQFQSYLDGKNGKEIDKLYNDLLGGSYKEFQN